MTENQEPCECLLRHEHGLNCFCTKRHWHSWVDGVKPDEMTVTVDLEGTPTLVGWEPNDAR